MKVFTIVLLFSGILFPQNYKDFCSLFNDIPEEGLYLSSDTHMKKDGTTSDKLIDYKKYGKYYSEYEGEYYAMYKFELDKNNTAFILRRFTSDAGPIVELIIYNRKTGKPISAEIRASSYVDEGFATDRIIIIGKEINHYNIIQYNLENDHNKETHSAQLFTWTGTKFIIKKI